MVPLIGLIVTAFLWILPAAIANGVPVLVGGGKPIDFGKTMKDGKRLLGDGKTLRGFFSGIVIGSLVGIVQGRAELGILLAFGALAGDLVGSFLKRRAGTERGHRVWALDQYDFLIGALLFAAIIEIPELTLLAAILIITPLLHIATNYCAYKLKLKKVPW